MNSGELHPLQNLQALQRVLITRNNDMIRAIYRWEVQPGAEETFIDAWSRGTEVIRGARQGGAWQCAPAQPQ